MASYYDAYDDGAEDMLKNTEEILKSPAVQALIEKEKAAAVAAKMATVDVIGDPAVTSIGNYAFNGCTGITTASFPTATSIGEHAFEGCSALTTADFPAATNVKFNAFIDCSALTTVNLPLVTHVGAEAFGNCSSCPRASKKVCNNRVFRSNRIYNSK